MLVGGRRGRKGDASGRFPTAFATCLIAAVAVMSEGEERAKGEVRRTSMKEGLGIKSSLRRHIDKRTGESTSPKRHENTA